VPIQDVFKPRTLADLLSHFGLVELPFQLSEDPRWQFLTPQLKACLSRTIMGIESRQGMVSLVGAYGAGKSMMIRRLVTVLAENPAYDIQVISNPSYTGLQLLKMIGDLYDVKRKGTKLAQFDAFSQYLMDTYAEGRCRQSCRSFPSSRSWRATSIGIITNGSTSGARDRARNPSRRNPTRRSTSSGWSC
jgi:type II secretory pathway predicted ATPase ExeA